MYVLNMNTFQFKDIFILKNKFKANDVKTMIRRSNLPKKSTIITLNCSPFTTYILGNFFKTIKYNHIYYNKNHFTPMIDYTRNYLQGMVLMHILNNFQIDSNDIKELAKTWNTEYQPIFKKIADAQKINPNQLYFK